MDPAEGGDAFPLYGKKPGKAKAESVAGGGTGRRHDSEPVIPAHLQAVAPHGRMKGAIPHEHDQNTGPVSGGCGVSPQVVTGKIFFVRRGAAP